MDLYAIDHNALDELIFDEMLHQSSLMSGYLKSGTLLMPGFRFLMSDMFFLLYKYTVHIMPYETPSLEKELLMSISGSVLVEKLRLRTKGSKSNASIAFKLLCDLLLEKLRGSELLASMLEELRELETLSGQMALASMPPGELLDFDLRAGFSKKEWESLKAIAKSFYEQASDETANRFLMDLKNFLESYAHQSSPAFKMLFERIDEKSKTELGTADPLTDFIEQASSALDSASTADDQATPESETLRFQGEGPLDENYAAMLKSALEERLSPFLNHYFLSQGKGKPPALRHLETLSPHEVTDAQAYSDAPASSNALPVSQQAIPLSRSQENRLRAQGTSSSFSGDASRNWPPRQFGITENEVMSLRASLNRQLSSLHLDEHMNQIADALDLFNEEIQTLNIQRQSVDNLSFDEVIALYKRFTAPQLIRFVNKVGRNKLDVQRLQYKRHRERSEPIDRISSSQNIDLLIDDEYISLALDVEAFENDFYDRYLRDDLLTTKLIAKKEKRKGPIVLCYDGSGSMEGAKILETQSHILSIMEIAKIQKRKMVLIQFASASEPLYIKELNPLSISAQDVLDILDTFLCGGTDFQKPLSKAMSYIDADPHRKSDILFITDGQCEISPAFKKEFIALKRKRQFRLFTIIMHAYTYHDYGDIGDISDAILDIQEQEQGNWNQDINKRLFSMI